MTDQSGVTEAEIREMEKKEFRKKFPSGWMEVSRYETLVLIIDAMLESPATREYTCRELADKAGSTEKSVGKRISSLVELGVVRELERGSDDTRFTLNNQSPITQKLYELNDIVNRVKSEELPKSLSVKPESENVNTPRERSRQSRFTGPMDSPDRDRSGSGFLPSEGLLS